MYSFNWFKNQFWYQSEIATKNIVKIKIRRTGRRTLHTEQKYPCLMSPTIKDEQATHFMGVGKVWTVNLWTCEGGPGKGCVVSLSYV